MHIDIRSGPAAVVASGEVTTFFGHGLLLQLALPGGVFGLELRFRTDPACPDVDVRTEIGDTGFVVELVNFDRADGRGSSDPVLLGALGDELLFLHFRVFRFGRTPDHTVHYTLFRASRHDVGWQDAAGGA
ncbi:MAG TPA: hypothetical protein PKA64_01915 [Myxococcota bacterium]|nr:hypothetical protein [Myxococcota bacterium]